MATAVFEPQESHLDKYFFPGMALLMVTTVFFGFALLLSCRSVRGSLAELADPRARRSVYVVDSTPRHTNPTGAGESRRLPQEAWDCPA